MMIKWLKIIAIAAMVQITPYVAFSQEQGSGDSVCAPAAAFVQDTSSRVLQIIKDNDNNNKVSTKLHDLFTKIVEIDWIGKFVLGSHWRTLSDEQKKQYLRQYKSFLLASYVPLFKEYNGQSFKIESISELANSQCMISMKIYTNRQNQAPYSVSYRLKHADNKYVVRDIVAEGVSLLTTQRAEFGAIISQKGFDSLLQRLSAKNATNAVE
jgi:phospholipid transport system substrate-binding protein